MRAKGLASKKNCKILIPTNFTGHGAIAGEYAVRLFNKLSCTYILETVCQAPKGSAGTLIKISDIIMRAASDNLRKEREEIEFGHPGVHILSKIEEGDAVTVIGQSIRKEMVDLLVIGHNSHMKKFLSYFVESPEHWPLLLVPNQQFSSPAKKGIVVSSPESTQGKMRTDILAIEKKLESASVKIKYSAKDSVDVLKKQLESFIKNDKIDLVILKAAKRSQLEGVITTHLLDEILLTCPVLLISE